MAPGGPVTPRHGSAGRPARTHQLGARPGSRAKARRPVRVRDRAPGHDPPQPGGPGADRAPRVQGPAGAAVQQAEPGREPDAVRRVREHHGPDARGRTGDRARRGQLRRRGDARDPQARRDPAGPLRRRARRQGARQRGEPRRPRLPRGHLQGHADGPLRTGRDHDVPARQQGPCSRRRLPRAPPRGLRLDARRAGHGPRGDGIVLAIPVRSDTERGHAVRRPQAPAGSSSVMLWPTLPPGSSSSGSTSATWTRRPRR